MSTRFELAEFWQVVADATAKSRGAFSRQWQIVFSIRDAGNYLLDVGRATLSPLANEVPADATLTTNLESLAALAAGTLNPSAPKPGQVCLLTGEQKAWEELSAALSRY